MDREGIKSIATMRQGKGVMLKPPPAAGALPGGPVPQASGAQLRDRAQAKQAYQSERPVSSSLPTAPPWPTSSPSAGDPSWPGRTHAK